MDRAIYDRMAQIDRDHWWFSARRKIIDRLIRDQVPLKAGAQILEMGCGTGSNIALLQQFARLARGIERHAQIAAAHHKLHDRVVDGNQPHAVSAQEGRCELVAHHRCEHLEHLYAAKDAGVFEHVVV